MFVARLQRLQEGAAYMTSTSYLATQATNMQDSEMR